VRFRRKERLETAVVGPAFSGLVCTTGAYSDGTISCKRGVLYAPNSEGCDAERKPQCVSTLMSMSKRKRKQMQS